MIIDAALTGEVPQPGLPLDLVTRDRLVQRALNLMQQTMDAPPTVARLAERLKVGRRTLERRFHRALGLTPATADKKIRIAQARLSLESGTRSVTQIANDTGFCDVSHLIRVFRDHEGVTPETHRSRSGPALPVLGR